MKKLIVRVDDVGQCLPGKVPDLSMERYAPFHEEFRKRSLPYCPCIIPGICDSEMIRWMFRNFHKETVPCLHGWDHVPTSNPDNEFGGISFDGKMDKIEMGMEKLACLWPRGMSAPFNRYDDGVLMACASSGLEFFLGGYGREKEEEYGYPHGIPFFPAEESLYMRNKGVHEILAAFDSLPDQEHPYVLTLHATWQQVETGETFLSDMLDDLKEHIVSPLDYLENKI